VVQSFWRYWKYRTA